MIFYYDCLVNIDNSISWFGMTDIEFFRFSSYLIPGGRAYMYIEILFFNMVRRVIMGAEDMFDLFA